MLLVPRPSPFISPAQPTLRDRPPKGHGWVHEVKFDGYRVQLHKAGKDVVIFSRNGADFTSRWPAIAYALQHLPAKSAIIDAEVVACNAKGMPDFAALHGRTAKPEEFCAWAFDLLELNGVGMRERPLLERRSKLREADRPVRQQLPALLGGLHRCRQAARRVRAPWARGHRIEATGSTLPRRQVRLGEGQDQGLARGQP